MRLPRPAVPPRSALVLAACALLVLAFAPAQYFGRQQDDLFYFLGARSLLTGRYCVLTSPGCPALTMDNPGWPLLMTPLALLTSRPAAFQALSALVLAAAPLAVWAWLRRRADETTALLAAALTASCPLALAQSGTVMSEAPYLLACLAALALAEDGRAGPVGGLGASLVLMRTAGLSALPGLAAPFARSPRRLARAALPAAAAYAAWSAWSWTKIHGVDKANLLATTYAGAAPAKVLLVVAANARYYLSEWGGCFLPPGLAGRAPSLLLGAALGALAVRGLARVLRRRADDPAAWVLLGGAALHALWGWQYERYLIPLLPLMLWALAEGLGRAAKPALAALLVLQLGAQTLPRLGRPSPWAEPELSRTYAWLAAQPRPALLSSAFFLRDGWWSGLPSVALPDAARAEDFAAALKKARVGYVLSASGQDIGLDADPSSAVRRRLERAEEHLRDARLFRKVHEEAAEHASVYVPL